MEGGSIVSKGDVSVFYGINVSIQFHNVKFAGIRYSVYYPTSEGHVIQSQGLASSEQRS